MQRIHLLYLCVALLCIAGCAKEETINNTDTKVGDSRVVFFPSISTNGDRLVIINQGGTFTDEGATAVLAGEPTEFTASGTVNTAVPGIYEITYAAESPDGYAATDFRTVVVIGNDVAANDFSGTYFREATAQTSTWTKIAPGVYEVENPGGAAAGVGYIVIAVNYTGTTIRIPRQIAFDPSVGNKEATSSNEIYNAASNPPTYTWAFLTGGYGTGLRTFVKQ